jgi:predicted dehydrogenase
MQAMMGRKVEDVRLGILGSGSISNYHIRGLQQAGGKVEAIFSLDLESAEQKAILFGIPSFSTQVEDLLENPHIDAVVIATPDFTHAEMAIAAAQAGKAVLVQKPMARNSAECIAILDACRKNGVACYVSYMHRYFPEIEALRQLLVSRALGEIYMVRQRNATPGAGWAEWFYRRELVGGGVVMQLGVHGIDLMRSLFGEIQAVKAATAIVVKERLLANGQIIRPDNEDLALAIYRFTSGLLGVHEMSYNEVAGTDRFRMEVYGVKSTVWLRSELGGLSLRRSGEAWEKIPLPDEDVGTRQHVHFLDMLTGKAPHDGSDLDGLAAVQVAEAIYRSEEKGDWADVRE